VIFCVAAPRAAGRIHLARRTEESFVVDLLNRRGGGVPRTCAPPLSTTGLDAAIVSSSVASGGVTGLPRSAEIRRKFDSAHPARHNASASCTDRLTPRTDSRPVRPHPAESSSKPFDR
jgi:hypothetical protein